MSTTQPIRTPLPPRKSFAQVAAAANVPIKPNNKPAKPQSPTSNSQPRLSSPPAGIPVIAAVTQVLEQAENAALPTPAATAAAPITSTVQQTSQGADVEQLGRLMDKTSVGNDVAVHPTVEELSKADPPSDTKSVTSRTTLALDEKESLRPDDSASMQAAVEDDSLSPTGSAVANSKHSSDPDARAFRDQLHEIDRTGARNLAAHRDGTAEKPPTPPEVPNGAIIYPSNPSPATYAVPQPPPPDHPALPLNAWNMPPDEKLLDALASPKDRLFVLKVEQDMIDFIKDSKEECLQLPATNSFYRLLSHKLADYYLLGHVVDESMMSVRIYRTPNCRLPAPLIGTEPAIEGSEPAPTAPARKIMRRNQTDGRSNEHGTGSDKNFDSLTSSKAPSDSGGGATGDEARDATGNSGDKSTLTREERENRYNEARARIFKDFETAEAAETSNNVIAEKGISRTSSASGVRKSKKKTKPKDDGFEARSAFDQYGQRIVPPESMDPSQFDRSAYQGPPQFAPPGQFQPGIPTFQPGQGPSFSSYNIANSQNAVPLQYWNGQTMTHGYASPQRVGNHEPVGFHNYGPPMNGYDGNQYPSANLASQSTPKGNHPTLANYSQNYMLPHENMGWNQTSFMNAYGGGYGYGDANAQYPVQYYPGHMMQSPPMAPAGPYPGFAGQENQYPHQGQPYPGYNNPHFNPRSQNFVPNMRGGFPGFPLDSNNTYPKNGQVPFYGGSPSMQRQTSNTSHGSSFSGNPPNHYQAGGAGMRPNGRGQTQSPFRYPQAHARGIPQIPTNSNNSNNSNSIMKWGTPANLPAKPPPPAVVSPFVEVPRDPDNQQPLPPKPFSAITSNNNPTPNNSSQIRSR